MLNKKFFCILNYFKTNKAGHKNTPRKHSPQVNKKAVFTLVLHFKFSTHVSKVAKATIPTTHFTHILSLKILSAKVTKYLASNENCNN